MKQNQTRVIGQHCIQCTTERLFFISAETETGRKSHFSFRPKPIPKLKKTFCFGRNRKPNQNSSFMLDEKIWHKILQTCHILCIQNYPKLLFSLIFHFILNLLFEYKIKKLLHSYIYIYKIAIRFRLYCGIIPLQGYRNKKHFRPKPKLKPIPK